MMNQLRKGLCYFTLTLMLATLWSVGYERQCDDALMRARKMSALPREMVECADMPEVPTFPLGTLSENPSPS